MQPFIDSHAHLHDIQDIDTAIQNACSIGIQHIIAVGMDLNSNQKTLAIARQFPDLVVPAIGYHPWVIRKKKRLISQRGMQKFSMNFRKRRKSFILWIAGYSDVFFDMSD